MKTTFPKPPPDALPQQKATEIQIWPIDRLIP